jgi:hypothetical protein
VACCFITAILDFLDFFDEDDDSEEEGDGFAKSLEELFGFFDFFFLGT